MPISESQKRSVRKYVKNNYDRMELLVPKGAKEAIKELANKSGESVNAFVYRLLQKEAGEGVLPDFKSANSDITYQ